MTSTVRVGDGSVVTLGAVIARAGEGTIYEIAGRPDWVAKIFHPGLKDLDAKRAKVAAMVASPPHNAMQSDGFVVLTWPLHVVDGDGGSGFIMFRVDTSNAVEIHAVSNPSGRMKPLSSAPQWTPHITWFHLVSVAANLCLAVETVHEVDAVIGDFQERNILVNDTTRVTLVDCDSMQFTDDNGNRFLCGVGRPEFTAPELAGLNLATTARRKPSDLFALAIHIHQLLMAGNHPFQRGTWMGGGEQPDALTLAKTGQWAGGPGSALHSHPLAPPVDFLPDRLQALFIRAFTDGARNPAARPTAAEWRQALLAVRVTNCPRGHQVPIETSRCPWCTIGDERTARRSQWASNRVSQTAWQVGSSTTPAAGGTKYRSAATAYAPTHVSSTTGGRNRRAPLLAVAGAAAMALAIGFVAIVVNSTSDTTAVPTTTRTTSASDSIGSPRASGGVTTTARRSPAPRPDASRVALNVNTPISQPSCDGMGIVVLSNAVTPGRYDAEVQSALNRFPGAFYLRTDQSCPSLRQVSDNGTPIYAVYRPAGRTQADVCAAVRQAGSGAYGKWLDTTTDPKYIIPC